MNLLVRIWARVTGGRLVWLRDMDGAVSLSIAKTDPWGGLIADRYWPFKIKIVRLLPGGKVEGSYVREWKDA